MDTVTLVENQIDDGQRLVGGLKKEGIVVGAACWVKPVDEDRWSLYIATPIVDEEGPLAAYRKVFRVLRSLGIESITSSDIQLVGAKHPLVLDSLDILRRSPRLKPMRSPQPLFGGIPVEELLVYPLDYKPVPVYGLIFRGEPGGALHLSLEPHNPNSILTINDNMGQIQKYPADTSLSWIVAAPKSASQERDEIGRLVLAWDCRGNRVLSSANEVWSLAKLELHGFRFLHEPSLAGSASSMHP